MITANPTGSTWACRILALPEVSPKGRHSEDRLRQRSNSCEIKVAHLFVGIIYRVDRDYRALLAAEFNDRACGLTYTSDLLRTGYTFALLIQACFIRRTFRRISNTCRTRGRPLPVCVCLLFAFSGGARSDALKGAVPWFALQLGDRRKDRISGCWRWTNGISSSSSSWRRRRRRTRRIGDRALCILAEGGISRSALSVSKSHWGSRFQRIYVISGPSTETAKVSGELTSAPFSIGIEPSLLGRMLLRPLVFP